MANGQALPAGQTFNREAVLESFRRRAGQPSSSAAIPGGAPAANTVTPGNPLAALPQTAQTVGGAPGLPESPSQPGRDAQAKAIPGESEIITKALIQQQKRLMEQGDNSFLKKRAEGQNALQ